MAFKKMRKTQVDITTPQALFRDLKNRKIQGLLEHQSIIIDKYIKDYYKSSNVALELPTGSGKTLVGLLIGEFKRLKDKKRIVYVCPTVQLVNQVVEQSKEKYGIKTIAFTGAIREYNPDIRSAFLAGESIAVTTYSAIFNTKTFFDNADIFIFDDAHSADSYISKFWSLEISRSDSYDIYIKILNLLKKYIGDEIYNRMIARNCDEADMNWVDTISIFNINDIAIGINPIIDQWDKEFKNKEAWKNLKGYLEACNIYISYNQILIKPIIPPTRTFQPFENAEQRIYMSATLGESGELERITGVEKIDRIGIPAGWDKQGLGRRFFMFPNSKFKDEEVLKFIIDSIKLEKRSVILVPDDKKKNEVKKCLQSEVDYRFMDNTDFKVSKREFISEEKAVAILANRFDGIDFEGDECRLLFIWGLPKAMNLQERFFITRLATSVLFNERIRTRLTQAIGRCTRGTVDYSAVCILGSQIEKELVVEEKRELFHPELAAEIEFGYQQSRELNSYDEAIENLEIFIEHGDEWDSADEQILELRNNIIEQRGRSVNKNDDIFASLKKSAKSEVKFQYALWNKDYKTCITEANEVLNNLNNDLLKGYRGYWNYILAYVYYKDLQDDNALKCKDKALKCIKGITWLPNILEESRCVKVSNNEYINLKQLESLEEYILKFQPGNSKYERKCSDIINGLSDRGRKVENALKELGRMIGYISDNKDDSTAPDTYWILSNGVCIISECKIKDKETTPILAREIREAKTHREWLVTNNVINKDTETYTVFITNSRYLHLDAYNIAEDIYYININEIQEFTNKALACISEIKAVLKLEGNIILREKAIEIIKINDFITSTKIVEYIKNNPIKSLESKN